MAQVISTKQETSGNTSYRKYGKKEETKNRIPLFRKPNFIMMGIGAVVLFIGYILLSGGASQDPNEFSEAIFDNRRLVVAPITILLGLIIEIVAIMWHPRLKDNNNESTAE
ncbi:MAG: DUF3098 domain-containing protein [Bacteroidales bacterium]|nr:DUF3098 domain-containing protein [Bacteroidales bacterium]